MSIPPAQRPADLPPEKPTHRSVSLSRVTKGRYEVRNVRGGSMLLGTGDDSDFTSVELLLAGMAGCSSVDVDYLTARRAEPTHFQVDVTAEKVADEQGNHLADIEVRFTVRFDDSEGGDAARAILPRIVAQSHDRLCTVSRTVILPTPVTMTVTED